MAQVGRVLLWTVALVAPGGFLLVPVLALQSKAAGAGTFRERLQSLVARARGTASRLQRYWTKS
jgi:hypothetical protein